MTTKINVYLEVFNSPYTDETPEEIYERRFQHNGFKLDTKSEDCFKIFDKEILLNIGDHIDMLHRFWIITWKCSNDP